MRQVDVLLEQADQLDAEANALLKGVRAAPVQPDLPSLVGTLGAAKRLVVRGLFGVAVVARVGWRGVAALAGGGSLQQRRRLQETVKQ